MKFPLEIARGRDFDVLGFGTNAVDFLISVPHFPSFASKVELSGYVRDAGGEVASTMTGLQRLGLKTAYAGSFGDDDAGKFGLQSLINEGVDVALCRVVEGAETQIAFIVIDEKTGERTVIWRRDPKLEYALNDSLADALPRCSILHLTQHDPTTCSELAKIAKANGVVVSLDVDNLFEGIDELLPLVDVLVASSEFPARLTGESDHRLSLGVMKSKYDNALVGMTLGTEGSLLLCEGQVFETSGFDVPGGCRDTTGAGDAFRAGLLYGLFNNESLESSGRMANAVAALKCRKVGARTALPTQPELEAFLK